MPLFYIKKTERKNRENGKRNLKKNENERMKVAYLPLKKNTTYGGMKFVPTSEVCVVRRNQSF